jgi:adenylate cyclase
MVDETQRRLAAILAADVAGYTRLVELDTDGTVAAWKSARDNVIKPLVDKKSGHIIKFTGDGFLVEFPSVQDAVVCAITMQEELRSSSLNFRMGINVGDITDDGGDVHGEGVNIAARLEALAEPGGICISGDVYNQVRNRIDASFKDMGEQEVKHVSQPVRVYAINPPEQKMSDHVTPPTSALPEKPSIAVLPFDNMSGDPEQEYFSDGITEDIITDISKVSSIFIVARNSSFTYKGRPVKTQEVCADLGVRYVVEGSVRKSGNRVRITAQLIDGSTGGHIWADRYDGTLENIFELQDEVTCQIVDALKVKLLPQEQEAIYKLSTSNVEAYDLYLKGRKHFHYNTKVNFHKAKDYFSRAIEIDNTYAQPYCGLADCDCYLKTEHGEGHKALVSAMTAATKAIELSPDLGEAHSSLGLVLSATGDYSGAISEFKAALQLDPGLYGAHYYWGRTCFSEGNLEEAAEHLEDAWKISPKDPQTPGLLLQIYRDLGRDSDLKHAAQEAVNLGIQKLEAAPEDWRACGSVAFGYLNLGKFSDARRYMALSLESNHEDSILNYNAACLYCGTGDIDKAMKHLRTSLKGGEGFQLKDWIDNDSDLDPVREHPQFKELIAKVL